MNASTTADPAVGADALRTYLAELVGTRQITPHLRELTVRGDFEGYLPLGGDEFLYLLLPPPGHDRIPGGAGFTWAMNAELPPDEQVMGAYYTVRRRRRRLEVRELDLWVVQHHERPGGDHGDAPDPRVGAASRWAASAAPGDQVALWGPRTAFEPPGDTTSWLLVADETGLAAVAAILEQLDASDAHPHHATVLVEVADAAHRPPLPTPTWADLRWLHRDGGEPGTGTRLLDALHEIELGGRCYAFGAAESKQISAIRRHLRDERQLPAERVSMTGYWRRG